MYTNFLTKFIHLFGFFNKYAIPIGLFVALFIHTDLRQFMIPIALEYYIMIGLIEWNKKNRSKDYYIFNPILLLIMDMAYLTFMICICYGWFILFIYLGGIKYE